MNVLYVTVDALRADHVTPAIMPATSSFLSTSISYENCAANGPGTPWSFPALLSSRYSGAVDGFGIPEAGDGHPTLAEVLADSGYATAGFTDNRFASSDYNYDRGIGAMDDTGATTSWKRLKQRVRENLDHDGILYQSLLRSYHVFDDVLLDLSGKESRFVRSGTLVDRLLAWVDDRERDWFAWLHPMDTHAPYEAPESYQQEYLDRTIPRRRSQELARKATHHPEELSDDEWDLQRSLYRAECAYLDDQLDRLLDSIRQSTEDTVIVLTADHGEMHGEHGLGGHPQQFWEEVIHVPCGIDVPGHSSQRVERQIGLIDVPPTILDSVEIDAPATWDGRSMLPKEDDPSPSRRHAYVDVGAELDRELACVRRSDGWKLMRHGEEGELLVDLGTNPDEDPRDDRRDDATEEYELLTDKLDDHLDEMEQRRAGEAGVEDEDMIEDHLRELGYLE